GSCWVCFGDSSTLDAISCWRIWPVANSFWPCSDEGRGSLGWIACFGLSPDACGRNGSRLLLSPLPRPLYAGIAPDSACTGIGSRAIERPSAENELVNRCEI